MPVTFHKRPFDILAYYDFGLPKPESESSLSEVDHNLLRLMGTLSITTLVHGVFRASGFDYVGSTDKYLHPAAQAAVAAMAEAGREVRVIEWPLGATEGAIKSMQDGLRAGMTAMRDELKDMASWSVARHATGELYIPPPEIEIGDPWMPEEFR